MKQWGTFPKTITICLQTREVHRNSGKQEVNTELSQMLRELLTWLHMT